MQIGDKENIYNTIFNGIIRDLKKTPNLLSNTKEKILNLLLKTKEDSDNIIVEPNNIAMFNDEETLNTLKNCIKSALEKREVIKTIYGLYKDSIDNLIDKYFTDTFEIEESLLFSYIFNNNKKYLFEGFEKKDVDLDPLFVQNILKEDSIEEDFYI